MDNRNSFQDKLLEMTFPFRRPRRKRAEELRDTILLSFEDLDIDLDNKPSLFGVTFDKKYNKGFDYNLFDEMLVQIDAAIRNRGIRKPVHQIRTLHWSGTSQELVQFILQVTQNYPSMKPRRLMAFKLDEFYGYKTDPGIHAIV